MLKLTTYDLGESIWIAPRHITSLYDHPSGYTVVTTVDCVSHTDFFRIKQDADHIAALVKQHL